MSHSESFVTTRGVRQRLFRGGSGEPVVFFHGGAGLSVWTPFFEAIASRHDFWAPEHPGFGGSDDPDRYTSVGDLAYHYLDWFAAHAPARFHLVANSIGGWIASEVAIRDCSRLRSLTLIGPAGFLPQGAAYEDSFAWTGEQSVRKLFFDQAIADRMLAAPSSESQRAIQAKNRATVAKLGRATRLHNPDLPKWLHRVACPALIVWGEHDALMPATFAEAWRKALPAASVELIPRAGHLPHAEQAALTADKVLAFLASGASR